MRIIFFVIGFMFVCSCATDDTASERRYGQQLVCHKGHTQAVSNADMFGHQDHGDTLGPCPKDQ